mmetsp:Transcript_19516/g.45788  ORF Transcript_19516/g.45788 Transcript_19516/m.45788 type:complete len:249 (-) Transcript_19516:707-1453(-)
MSESSSEELSSILSSPSSFASVDLFCRPRFRGGSFAAGSSSAAAVATGMGRRPVRRRRARFLGDEPSSSSSSPRSMPSSSPPPPASPAGRASSFSLSLDTAAGFRQSCSTASAAAVPTPSSARSPSSSPLTVAPYPNAASLGTGNDSAFHLLSSPRNLDWNRARSNSFACSSCILRSFRWDLRCRPPYRVGRWMDSLLSRRERRIDLWRFSSSASPKCSSIAASNAAMLSLGTATVSSLPFTSSDIAW